MGGKEASRGFLYQGIASVLEALTDKSNWDKIYVEFPTSNDKVDIALEQQHQTVKCIQVKSTVNTFSKSDIQTWLKDLIEDVKSPEYKLCLIGQCDKTAITFINSIEKYYGKALDQKANLSLEGFDTKLLKNKQIQFTILPFEVENLQTVVRDSLHKYISGRGLSMTYDEIDFIASATVNDQIVSSTHGKGIDRKDFDAEMKKRILLVAKKYKRKRKSIGVESFTCGKERLEDETENCLSLLSMFNKRILKDEYDWNKDIYEGLKKFLLETTDNKCAYQIFLNTHCSIAFAAGRILNSKSGIDVFPIQKSSINGTVLWDVDQPPKKDYANWHISHEKFNGNQYDSALVLNVTRSIYKDVIEFIKEKNLSVGHIINCELNEVGATNFSIEDGTHAALLASSIFDSISQRSKAERRATLHIFASAPNALMFFLGKNSVGFGRCILYEYDFEQSDSGTYSQSISFVN